MGTNPKDGKTLLVQDFVADIRRIKRVESFKNEFEDVRRNEIENVFIENAFSLKFESEQTVNFLDLVTKDISEDMDEDAQVYFEL